MKKKIKSIVRRTWLIVFFAVIYGFASFFNISIKKIWSTLVSLDLLQFVLLTSVYFLISFFTVLNRKYLLAAIQCRCSIKNLILIHFSSLTAHYSTPVKIGFPLTVFLLKRFENVPYSSGSAMIMIELIVGLGLSGFFAVVGGVFLLGENYGLMIRSFLVLVLLISAILVFFYFYKKNSKQNKALKLFDDFVWAFKQVTFRKGAIYLALAGGLQIFSTTNLLLLVFFFSAKLTVFEALTASSTAYFLGAISMIPMGLGVREGSMLFMLRRFGIEEAIGIPIVTIQRLLSTGLTFVLGAIFASILGVRNIVIEENST